jgi:hypothetical protein
MSVNARRFQDLAVAAMAVVLIATAAVGVPMAASAATTDAGAQASDRSSPFPPPPSSKQAVSTDGSVITGTATAGNSTATFNVFPALSAGTITGQSATVAFRDFQLFGRESAASAFVVLSDQFNVSGDIDGEETASLSVAWQGTLSPNNDFEQQHFAAFGRPTVTASANLHLSYFFLTSSGPADIATRDFRRVGGQVGNTNPCSPNPCVVGEEALLETEVPFTVRDDRRDFGLILVIGAASTRGGSFNFGGGIGSSSLAALAAGDSLLDDSFFEIVVRVPPGLSVNAEGGWFMRQALISEPVPEPATSALLAVGLGLLALLYTGRARAG